MKRIIVFSVLLALGLVLAGGALSAAKDYRAERFDATWQVGSDGSLLVSETVTFRFEGGPFTFVYRELPEAYSDGVEVIEVRLDGEPLREGSGAGFYEVEDDDPLKVTWRFEPASDVTRSFDLVYRVRGVVRREGGEDMLWWNFLPTDYEYPIDAAALRVAFPASAQQTGAPAVRRGAATVTEGDGEVRFDAVNIPAGEPLTVALRFAEGSLISEPPAWQVREREIAERAPLVGGVSALAAILGGGWLALLWQRGRRASTYTPSTAATVYAPPSDMAPALAGALADGNGKATAVQALATLFSLAQRELVAIEKTGEQKWYGDPPYTFRKTPALTGAAPGGADLSDHEQQLVNLMFADKNGQKDKVTVAEASRRLQSKLSPFTRAVEAELTAQGYTDPARRAYASRFYATGAVFLASSILTAIAGAFLVNPLGGWILLLPLALFVLSMIGFILGASYSPLTEQGVEAGAQWRGFRERIKAVTKGREPSWDTRMFDRYFAYAAAFGLAEGWAKAFEKAGGTEAPAWFRGLAAERNDGSIVAFIAMTSAMNSSSVSGAGSGGGGGAGGGGGSGAG